MKLFVFKVGAKKWLCNEYSQNNNRIMLEKKTEILRKIVNTSFYGPIL